jgi:hypothetical protein
MVNGYPFNIMDNPVRSAIYCTEIFCPPSSVVVVSLLPLQMYVGTTISFVGAAVMNKSPAGLVLTLFVHFVYRLVIMWEQPVHWPG